MVLYTLIFTAYSLWLYIIYLFHINAYRLHISNIHRIRKVGVFIGLKWEK